MYVVGGGISELGPSEINYFDWLGPGMEVCSEEAAESK